MAMTDIDMTRMSVAEITELVLDSVWRPPHGRKITTSFYRHHWSVIPRTEEVPSLLLKVGHGVYTVNDPRSPLVYEPRLGQPETRGKPPDTFRRLSVWKLSEMTRSAFPDGLFTADGRKVVKKRIDGDPDLIVDHLHGHVWPAGTLVWTHPSQAATPLVATSRFASSSRRGAINELTYTCDNERAERNKIRADYEPLRQRVELEYLLLPDDVRQRGSMGFLNYDHVAATLESGATYEELAQKHFASPGMVVSAHYLICGAGNQLNEGFVDALLWRRHGITYHHERFFLFNPVEHHVGDTVKFTR